jgi:murein DD-endopeptidase MepM/ murein hydrolase activator NlpD
MLVPHSPAGGKTKTFNISVQTIYVLGIVLLSLIVFSIANLTDSTKYCIEKLRLIEAQRQNNRRLKKEFKHLVEKSGELKERLSKIEEIGANLEALVGIMERRSRGKTRNSGGPKREISVSPHAFKNPIQYWRNEFCNIHLDIQSNEDRFKYFNYFFRKNRKKINSIPFISPVRGRITSTFGYRRSPFSKRREYHEGVDIRVQTGTPIIATADGTVVFAGWKRGYGRTVIVDHGYGYRTVYAHNYRLLVRKGQFVRRGQRLALGGNTGRSTGPHLHYEIRFCNRPVNPLRMILN